MHFYGVCFHGGFAYCTELSAIQDIINHYGNIFMHSYTSAMEAYSGAYIQFVKNCSVEVTTFVCPPGIEKMGPNTIFHTPYVLPQPQRADRFFAVMTQPYYGIYTDVTGLMKAIGYLDQQGIRLGIKEETSFAEAFTTIRQTYLQPTLYRLPQTRYAAVPMIFIDRTDVLYESPFNSHIDIPPSEFPEIEP